jgi:TolB protein
MRYNKVIRKILLGVSLLFSGYVFSIDLELTQGINSQLPIGIEQFGSDIEARSFTEIIENDLSLSGQFKFVRSNALHAPADVWQRLGADSVVYGQIQRIDSNRLSVHVELVDVAMRGRPLLAKDYQVDARSMRSLAHHVSDEIYQKLTGVRGVFSTRIAYVLVQRSQYKTRYSLEVADIDGSNPRSLLISSDPIMSPAWSPDARQIAYVSFEKKRAQIFTVSVETGQRRLVTDFPGINGAPAWSPNGRELAVVLSKGGHPKIYTIDVSNGNMKQVTFGDAIDTEPRYTPDGRSLLFTSGRGGSPQIYKLDLSSGSIVRLTFDGNYNAKASMSANQQQLVMLHRGEDRAFNIGLMQIGRNEILSLTDSPADESPSLAPNGRLVVYATRVQDRGVLGLVSVDGHVHLRMPARDGDIQEPAWSPYLG